ncbi:MAG: ATP-binding cassette domain-containing protein [Candidatus Hydrogenedens sp.]|nr:ATP-binding cassette domain-containing protein [Candidatus Hydrogenedens sp.]
MPDPTPSPFPLECTGLSRRFRRTEALHDITLRVEPGQVFGVVGENGAGKTTLMNLAMGLLRPTSGSIRIFGMDPVMEPEKTLARIGYLSEDHDLPGWMRLHELMSYTAAFFPDWDQDYAESMREQFELDPGAKVRQLSRGQRALAGLLCAMAHRPPLLLLDEPSSGLDAVVRRDILGAIIRTVADEGRTVVFSSHLLDEVERVADHVALIRQGRLVETGSMEHLKARHHRVTLRLAEAQHHAPDLPGMLSATGTGREWTLICEGSRDELLGHIAGLPAEIMEQGVPTLEEIFVARAGRKAAKV